MTVRVPRFLVPLTTNCKARSILLYKALKALQSRPSELRSMSCMAVSTAEYCRIDVQQIHKMETKHTFAVVTTFQSASIVLIKSSSSRVIEVELRADEQSPLTRLSLLDVCCQPLSSSSSSSSSLLAYRLLCPRRAIVNRQFPILLQPTLIQCQKRIIDQE